MADIQLYTNEAAIAKATEIKTALALSKLRFFIEGLALTRFTTIAQLEAAEADFDGYTAGGYTLTAWTGPTAPSGGGALLTSPIVNPNFNTPSDPPVTNMIGGWWIEDASGDVRIAGTYDPPRPMQTVGDGWAVVVQILEAKNPVSIE